MKGSLSLPGLECVPREDEASLSRCPHCGEPVDTALIVARVQMAQRERFLRSRGWGSRGDWLLEKEQGSRGPLSRAMWEHNRRIRWRKQGRLPLE